MWIEDPSFTCQSHEIRKGRLSAVREGLDD
jgi:hypothetical protein